MGNDSENSNNNSEPNYAGVAVTYAGGAFCSNIFSIATELGPPKAQLAFTGLSLVTSASFAAVGNAAVTDFSFGVSDGIGLGASTIGYNVRRTVLGLSVAGSTVVGTAAGIVAVPATYGFAEGLESIQGFYGDCLAHLRYQCRLLAADPDGQVLGALYASAGEFQFGVGAYLTNVHALAVDGRLTPPKKRVKVFGSLVKAVNMWGESRGGDRVMVSDTTGTNITAVQRTLVNIGAKPVGGIHVI